MILVDTSGVLAQLDRDSRQHAATRTFIASSDELLVLSPFVLAELDYLLADRFGIDAELELLADVQEGAYDLAPFGAADVGDAAEIVSRYRDLRIGLTDASIVVLGERLSTNRVLTLDERHFRTLKTMSGKPFVVLPADA